MIRFAFLQKVGYFEVETVLPSCSPVAPSEARFGAVTFVHRFGSALNANLHFHCCVIDGLFSVAEEGLRFHPAASLTEAAISRVQQPAYPGWSVAESGEPRHYHPVFRYALYRLLAVAAHLSSKDDKLEKVAPLLKRYGNFAALPGQGAEDETAFKSLRQSETIGRPLAIEAWMENLEKMTGAVLKPRKRGPKKWDRNDQ